MRLAEATLACAVCVRAQMPWRKKLQGEWITHPVLVAITEEGQGGERKKEARGKEGARAKKEVRRKAVAAFHNPDEVLLKNQKDRQKFLAAALDSPTRLQQQQQQGSGGRRRHGSESRASPSSGHWRSGGQTTAASTAASTAKGLSRVSASFGSPLQSVMRSPSPRCPQRDTGAKSATRPIVSVAGRKGRALAEALCASSPPPMGNEVEGLLPPSPAAEASASPRLLDGQQSTPAEPIVMAPSAPVLCARVGTPEFGG